jgi:hypothetical protein
MRRRGQRGGAGGDADAEALCRRHSPGPPPTGDCGVSYLRTASGRARPRFLAPRRPGHHCMGFPPPYRVPSPAAETVTQAQQQGANNNKRNQTGGPQAPPPACRAAAERLAKTARPDTPRPGSGHARERGQRGAPSLPRGRRRAPAPVAADAVSPAPPIRTRAWVTLDLGCNQWAHGAPHTPAWTPCPSPYHPPRHPPSPPWTPELPPCPPHPPSPRLASLNSAGRLPGLPAHKL